VRDIRRVLLPLMFALPLLMAALMRAEAKPQQDEPFSFVVRVEHQDTYDIKGIQFYSLVTPGVGDSALLSVDGDLPLSKVLLAHQGQKIRLSIEPVQVQELAR